MGHQQDQVTPCGDNACPGSKSTVYVYDDDGNCISQTAFPCNTCGRQ